MAFLKKLLSDEVKERTMQMYIFTRVPRDLSHRRGWLFVKTNACATIFALFDQYKKVTPALITYSVTTTSVPVYRFHVLLPSTAL